MQYVRALKEAKPRWFLYENNASMSDEIKNEITKQLGVEPIMIDSADFSTQIRKRYYWTNIPVCFDYVPADTVFADIEWQNKKDFKLSIFAKYAPTVRDNGCVVSWDTSGKGNYSQQNRARRSNFKMNTLPSSGNDKNNIYIGGYLFRKIHPVEAERLQTLPDDYTACISSAIKRTELCGNGWTVDVIAHIFKYLKTEI
jgi:DNA (cytosine-5)-methyltransferase 3A